MRKSGFVASSIFSSTSVPCTLVRITACARSSVCTWIMLEETVEAAWNTPLISPNRSSTASRMASIRSISATSAREHEAFRAHRLQRPHLGDAFRYGVVFGMAFQPRVPTFAGRERRPADQHKPDVPPFHKIAGKLKRHASETAGNQVDPAPPDRRLFRLRGGGSGTCANRCSQRLRPR